MKKIDRLPPPDCLDNSLPNTRKKKREFYRNLRDPDGRIRPRWNTTCKDEDGISRIRAQLLRMSHYCCAYCGKHIEDGEMDVDHYLPSSQFPYLAYCWENFLPACGYCNQNTKAGFTPNSLQGKRIVEDIIADSYLYDYVYDKDRLLGQIVQDDRLIEPTFDDPEEHVEFNPEFFFYTAKTPIGHITISKFFIHKEVAQRWEKISMFIRELVLEETPKEIILHYIRVHSYEYVCLKFYEYWLQEKREGRIGR